MDICSYGKRKIDKLERSGLKIFYILVPFPECNFQLGFSGHGLVTRWPPSAADQAVGAAGTPSTGSTRAASPASGGSTEPLPPRLCPVPRNPGSPAPAKCPLARFLQEEILTPFHIKWAMEAGEEPAQQKTFRVILHRTMQMLHEAEDLRSQLFAYQLSLALKLT